MEAFEVIFNKAKFDALPAELKAILKYAAHRGLRRSVWTWRYDRYSKDLEAIKARGVNVDQDARSRAQGAARRLGQGDRPSSRKEPFFKKVIDVAEGLGEAHVSAYLQVNNLQLRRAGSTAYKHFFG